MHMWTFPVCSFLHLCLFIFPLSQIWAFHIFNVFSYIWTFSNIPPPPHTCTFRPFQLFLLPHLGLLLAFFPTFRPFQFSFHTHLSLFIYFFYYPHVDIFNSYFSHLGLFSNLFSHIWAF